MDIYLDKIYDIEMTMYLKTLKKDQIKINQKVCDDTLKSVLNRTAIFLYNKKCPICGVILTNPTGIRVQDGKKHEMCGNCGYN